MQRIVSQRDVDEVLARLVMALEIATGTSRALPKP